MPEYLQIAIDGPAGAGKSTVAKNVAMKLGLLYFDTGAMYRVIAYKALKQEIPLDNEPLIRSMTETTSIYLENTETKRVWCDGEDVTQAIRSPEVSNAVSIIAGYPSVRAHLVELQRKQALQGGVVMDGRDIGTYVLPDAHLKIFLTASTEERTRRRWLELKDKGSLLSFEQVQDDIVERDKRDTEREIAPLKPAQDAIFIDTTYLSIDEIVDEIIKLSREVQK